MNTPSQDSPKLNRYLFAEIDTFTLVQKLTGLPSVAWPLADRLEALGLSFKEYDPIDVEMLDLFNDRIDAAFLAGYLVGRNPDLLLLQNIGSCFLDSE